MFRLIIIYSTIYVILDCIMNIIISYKLHVLQTSDKIDRYYQVLWIWFLSEPKKVIEAIKDVKAKSTAGGSSSFKTTGIMCKKIKE